MKIEMLERKVRDFGNLFQGRLNDEMLQDAIGYIEHNEIPLAFEIICDHLSEYDVLISQKEYDLIIEICGILKININNSNRIKYLKKLIIN